MCLLWKTSAQTHCEEEKRMHACGYCLSILASKGLRVVLLLLIFGCRIGCMYSCDTITQENTTFAEIELTQLD